MSAALDHLVLAVPDLDEAVREMAYRTGVLARSGGSHPRMGTRNALVGLSWKGERRCYLELLGPDPAQPDVPAEETMLGFGRLEPGFTPRLHAWAVRPTDLDATLRAAEEAGIDVGQAVSASRTTPTGEELSWRLAVPDPLGLGGVQPFLIDWTGAAHPTDADLPTMDLLSLELTHPDPDLATRVLTVLDVVHVGVVEGSPPALRAVQGTPAGVVELA